MIGVLRDMPVRPSGDRDGRGPVLERDPQRLDGLRGELIALLQQHDLPATWAVADPAIADVSVVNSRAVLVNGKTPGITSLVIIDRLKIRQYQVRVTPAYGRGLTDVTNAINLPGVTARQAGDSLILEGDVDSAEDKRRCNQECPEVFSDRDSLMAYESLSCRDAVEYVKARRGLADAGPETGARVDALVVTDTDLSADPATGRAFFTFASFVRPPGLWRWTARHAEWHPGEWGAEVASFAADAGDAAEGGEQRLAAARPDAGDRVNLGPQVALRA